MAFIVSGCNDFYEGWLARLLQQPLDTEQPEGWQVGWQTADETDRVGRMWALEQEITGGAKHSPHISVTPTKD
jgi:hypothetical protein